MSTSQTRDGLSGLVIDGFELRTKFAGGAFGAVYLAQHLSTGFFCAAKVLDLSRNGNEAFECIMREISVFMQVSHENMTTLYRLSLQDTFLVFFYEYVPNGTLLAHVRAHFGLNEGECKRLFFQLYGVVRHLHLHRFLVHRDLKLENCLIDANMNLRLIDFGLCSTIYCNTLKKKVGTPGYMAPEVIAGVEYSEKCDVFSLGVCLYTMRAGKIPFRAQGSDSVLLIAQIHDLLFGPEFSDPMSDLIRRMLEPRQSDRVGLLEIVQHPWMSGFPHAGGVIAPKPIVFFRINDVSDFLKFRRMYVVIDEEALSRTCTFLGMTDTQKLTDALNEGLVNDETTIYYLMLRPCPAEPPLPPPKSAAEKTRPGKKQASTDGGQRYRTQFPIKPPVPKIKRPDGGTRSPRLWG
jgi:serine/threonine protein kinase